MTLVLASCRPAFYIGDEIGGESLMGLPDLLPDNGKPATQRYIFPVSLPITLTPPYLVSNSSHLPADSLSGLYQYSDIGYAGICIIRSQLLDGQLGAIPVCEREWFC